MNEINSPLYQEKSIALCIVLSLLTFGIYYIVWMYGICKRVKLLNGEIPDCGVELICLIFVPFYSLYWFYTRSKKLSEGAMRCGIHLDDKSLVNLLLALFGFSIVAVALMQSDLNSVAQSFQSISGPR